MPTVAAPGTVAETAIDVSGSTLQTGADPATVGLGLLTQLGDVWFVTVVAVLAYWLGPRTPLVGDGVDRGRQATVLGAVLLGIALVVATKIWIAAPRPPGGLVAPTVPSPTVVSVTAWLAGADGPAFPSGHAVLVTVGWGGLAWAVRAGSVRRRLGVAAAVVAVVTATRVALALHTPEQVLAGIALGVGVLGAVVVLGTARWALGLAVGVGAVAIAAVGPVPDVLVAAGLAGGGLVTWLRWAEALRATGRSGALAATAIGALTVLPLLVGLATLDVPAVAHLGASAVVGVVLVALPLVGERVVSG